MKPVRVFLFIVLSTNICIGQERYERESGETFVSYMRKKKEAEDEAASQQKSSEANREKEKAPTPKPLSVNRDSVEMIREIGPKKRKRKR